MNHPFTGAGVALVTPFTENNSIDFDALGQILKNQIEGGMDYLVALGTTSETPTLSENEQKEIVSFIKQNSKGLPVVVGMGGNNTQKIIEQIDKYDFNGVSGLLVVTPYYNRPSQEGMFHHYLSIAKVSPVPIILYNVPSRTGVNLESDTVIRLAEASPKIVAVKEASGIVAQATRIKKYSPAHFSVISGDDVMALPLIAIGGIGVISVIANALPGKLSKLVHFALDGKFSEAGELHTELIDLFKLLFKEGNPEGVKALLHIQGIIRQELRAPLYRISDALYNEIKAAYLKLK
ncbi:MAG: 4-hydroxy-tetrahydrodipicolinate synthase [Mariniphaga sp.]|jgi:4-hydroxy-tetrahydrodipicolinate synthase|nr:4-hydroxy-tetrahydrodipicolinate synthase [Mariniphaga sp.]